jgi:hypothetical protein
LAKKAKTLPARAGQPCGFFFEAQPRVSFARIWRPNLVDQPDAPGLSGHFVCLEGIVFQKLSVWAKETESLLRSNKECFVIEECSTAFVCKQLLKESVKYDRWFLAKLPLVFGRVLLY